MIPEEQSGGITSLPRLYFTSNFMKHKEGLPMIKDPNDIKCNICEMEDADSFCQDCHEFYCDGCQRGHKKGKATKSHKFISVDDGWKLIWFFKSFRINISNSKINSLPYSSTSNYQHILQDRSRTHLHRVWH